MALVGWNGKREFLIVASKHAPLTYRWFGKTLTVTDVDRELGDDSDWLRIRASLQVDDRIWPFTVNANTMVMRAGFVFVRNGRPFDAIVTMLS